MQYYSNLTGW